MLRRFALLCLALFPVLAFAQSTTNSDPAKEAFVYERILNRIRFENDGSGTRESEAAVRIQSQAGVQEFGQMIFGYSSAIETLDVAYLRVRKPDGRVIETPTTGAQDLAPETLRQAPMYTDYRQRHVSVTSLAIGDVLEYRTVVHVKTPIIPNQFWYEHSFPRTMFVTEDRLEIDVPKSRELKLKSPNRKYETVDHDDRRLYIWSVKNITPERKGGSDDDDDTPDLDELKPDVQVSTFTDWQQLAHWYAKVVDEQSQPDDAVKKKAAELTAGATTASDKVQRIYNYVALNVRYVSISLGVGRLQPHPARDVFQNSYGDCKDKHTLLASLLRAQGIRADAVLIDSSRKLDPDVPSPGQFDHVISAVHVGDNLIWLDTTAEVAPFGLIFYSLRNKQALFTADDATAGLITTPADAPMKNVVTTTIDGKFSEHGAFDANIELTAQGDSGVPMRQAFRQTPQARWEDLLKILSRAWGFAGDISDVHLDPLEETSKPFRLTYHYHKDDYFPVPSQDARFLPLPLIELRRPPERIKPTEAMDVGPSVERTYKARLQLAPNYSLTLPPAVKMSRDYGDYSATYNIAANVLDAQRHLVLRVNQLPASRKSDYESFRNVAAGAGQQTLSCAITRPSGPATPVVAKGDQTPDQMRKAAATAIRNEDFDTAVTLLKRVVEQEPNQQDAWDDLGVAYARLNNHDEAIKAFRKQIEVNAFHPKANDDLGAELQQLGRFDEAAAAYRKQLEISPGDKIAHKNLGIILAQQKKDSEARTELEAAAAIAPGDPEVKMALAAVYDRTGEKDKAQALLKSVTGGAAASAGADIYSDALRDDIDADQTVQSARQVLDQIGDQFDSGEYTRIGPSAFSAMNLVALSWARLGWASFLQGDMLEGMKYLNACWTLSQSGTVANRLARVYEKEGQHDKALQMFALAAAAGGAEADKSRAEVARLAGADKQQQEIAKAQTAFAELRTVKLPAAGRSGAAQFNLVFDGSSKPERVEFFGGDDSLRALEAQLRQKEYPVKFPDVSSVKIIRRGALSCTSSGCSMLMEAPATLAAPAGSVATDTKH